MDLTAEAIQEIVRLAKPQVVIPNSNIPVALIPEGYELRTVPEAIHNEYAEGPHKLEATRTFYAPESFSTYFKTYADSDSIVLASPTRLTVNAIIDYHQASPGEGNYQRWQRHTATLVMQKSEQLKAWIANSGKLMNQVDFAEFLQENAADVSQPSVSEMLTIARDLRATVGMTAVSNFNQQTGEVELSFKNEVNASAGLRTQKIEIPERFFLNIPLFANDEPRPVICDFRYRAGQEMKLFYKLYQIDRMLEQRFKTVIDSLNEAIIQIATMPILIGE